MGALLVYALSVVYLQQLILAGAVKSLLTMTPTSG